MRLTQISTVGGEAETPANALTVKPWIRPSSEVVTTATPVAKRRIAARNSSVDAGTDADPVTDRDDRGVELGVVEKRLVERADRHRLLLGGRLRNGRRPARPQQVVDDDDPRALEHRDDHGEIVLALGLDRID